MTFVKRTGGKSHKRGELSNVVQIKRTHFARKEACFARKANHTSRGSNRRVKRYNKAMGVVQEFVSRPIRENHPRRA